MLYLVGPEGVRLAQVEPWEVIFWLLFLAANAAVIWQIVRVAR